MYPRIHRYRSEANTFMYLGYILKPFLQDKWYSRFKHEHQKWNRFDGSFSCEKDFSKGVSWDMPMVLRRPLRIC